MRLKVDYKLKSIHVYFDKHIEPVLDAISSQLINTLHGQHFLVASLLLLRGTSIHRAGLARGTANRAHRNPIQFRHLASLDQLKVLIPNTITTSYPTLCPMKRFYRLRVLGASCDTFAMFEEDQCDADDDEENDDRYRDCDPHFRCSM